MSGRLGAGPVARAVLLSVALLAGSCADGDVSLDRSRPGARGSSTSTGSCEWTTAGGDVERTHTTTCESAITPDTVGDLVEDWFLETPGEVTAAPAVTSDRVIVGDWSGRVTAAERSTGRVVWTRDLPVDPNVYAGQITATPSLATLDGRQVVIVGAGRTVHALATSDGATVWSHTLGNPDDSTDPSEIEASVAVVDDLVIVPYDVHNAPAPAGLIALAVADGSPRWRFDPEVGVDPGGCGDVWGSPAVDVADRLVVIGTANCPTASSWTKYSEAIVGIDLDSGRPRWSFQPHEKDNLRDWDFAGAPNLFEFGGRRLAGLGNKDGWYYAVDRRTGDLVWKAEAQKQSSDGGDFSFGGFIGATAVAPDADGRLVVAGITAIGDCPCVHAFDAEDGTSVWRSNASSGSYGAVAAAGAMVFGAGLDRTLRAWDLADGEVLWRHELRAISSSGPAIVDGEIFIGVGFREPNSRDAPAGGGVHRFRLLRRGESTTAPEISTTTVVNNAVTALAPSTGPCVAEACDLDLSLKTPPAGLTPRLRLRIESSPLRITLDAAGLGTPAGWLRAGSDAVADGATAYGLIVSTRDDQPETGSILCTFAPSENGCTATSIPGRADRYTRLTVAALVDGSTMPSLVDGYDRLVSTRSFDPALIPEDP